MTVHEAHEYNSLIDQIRAKYELLDSGVLVSWHPSI